MLMALYSVLGESNWFFGLLSYRLSSKACISIKERSLSVVIELAAY